MYIIGMVCINSFLTINPCGNLAMVGKIAWGFHNKGVNDFHETSIANSIINYTYTPHPMEGRFSKRISFCSAI